MSKRYMPLGQADEALAREILRQHHADLLDFEVVFQFAVNENGKGEMVDPKPNKHGVIKLGKAKCFPAEERSAGCPDFLITLCYNWWEQATDKQRAALVDHELCHCGVDDGPDDSLVPMSVPHEFEGFLDELRRHGAWDQRLKQVEHQLQLWEVDDIERRGEEGLKLIDELATAAQ